MSERKKITVFDYSTVVVSLVWRHLSREPREYPHKSYIAGN